MSSSTKKITIKDLCPEEKKKIGELLKRLSTETEEKNHLQQLLEQDKQFYESQIKTLKESSILHQKTTTDPLEFKSESFAQSFVAAPDKQGATSQDIKFLRNKFDSVYSKLKKAVAINETLINKNCTTDSIDEEIPNTYKPVPIKQDTNVTTTGYKNGNLLTTSLMAEDDSMNFGNGNEEKSFISTNANEDLLNGFGMISVNNNNNNVGVYNKRNVNCYQFGNSLNSNSGNRSNSPAKVNKFNFGSGNTGSKYKEILGRIREKSQEQNNMRNNNNISNNKLGISQLTNSYNSNNNNINSFRISKNNTNNNNNNNNNNAFISPSSQFQTNNNMNISISKEFQMQFNPINNNNQSNNMYQPQTIDNINLNLSINNNNNNNTNNNEYMNVINFLNNNKHSVNNFSKLNTSQNDNNTLNNILSTSSSITNTSKLEDACNDNVFNYIFKLEGCTATSNSNSNSNSTKRDKTKEVSSQMDEIEKELNDLQQSNFPLDHTDYDYQPEHHNKRNPIFNDFKSISSKYI